MADIPDIPDFNKSDLIEFAEGLEEQARENAPTTVKLSWGGTIIGAVAFGPAGGVVGATVGSGIGYLKDEGYFDSDEEPDVVEADVKDMD